MYSVYKSDYLITKRNIKKESVDNNITMIENNKKIDYSKEGYMAKGK